MLRFTVENALCTHEGALDIYINISLKASDKKQGIPEHAFMQEIRSLNLESERAKMSAESLRSGNKNEIQKKNGKRT